MTVMLLKLNEKEAMRALYMKSIYLNKRSTYTQL
jgi:hypothetical protein